MTWVVVLLALVGAAHLARAGPGEPPAGETWLGLRVAPERDCASYDAREWSYPPDLDVRYASLIGGYYAPYTGRVFDTARELDIEHVVARHEAAQSGGCGWPAERKRAFARDPMVVVVAGPRVNRVEKSDRDPAEWMPPRNRRWYALRWMAIKAKYGLTIDAAERDALAAAIGASQ